MSLVLATKTFPTEWFFFYNLIIWHNDFHNDFVKVRRYKYVKQDHIFTHVETQSINVMIKWKRWTDKTESHETLQRKIDWTKSLHPPPPSQRKKKQKNLKISFGRVISSCLIRYDVILVSYAVLMEWKTELKKQYMAHICVTCILLTHDDMMIDKIWNCDSNLTF